MEGVGYSFSCIRTYLLMTLSGVVIFCFLMLSAYWGWGQCGVGPSNFKTYEQTRTEFTPANTREVGVGKNIEPAATNITITTKQLMLIPNGVTFRGSISSVANDAVICIAASGVLSPTGLNNVSGTIRNYNTSTTLTISNSYNGSLKNYGGTINVNNTGNLNSGKYILNSRGKINWNNSMTLSDNTTNIYNEGLIYISGQMSGQGCIHNEDWITIGSYNWSNNITNNGKIELLSTALSFNGSGNVVNNCALFSAPVGASFQNNTSIINNGLIYLPFRTWENKSAKTFTNGSTGVIRTQNLTNEGTDTGSGWFYVSGSSYNKNQGIFGQGTDNINFYDAPPDGTTGPFDTKDGSSSTGNFIFYTPFPIPKYSPDLSNYQCGSIIMGGSVQPGEIEDDQTLCLGVQPEEFENAVYATCPGGDCSITYQWQKSTDKIFYANIASATSEYYTETSLPAVKSYCRRKAKASYSEPDSIKNSSRLNNEVTLIIINTLPPSITSQSSNFSSCTQQNATFTATAGNYSSLNWQVSFNGGSTWNNLSNGAPYSGVTTNTLNRTGVTVGMNNYWYRLAAFSNSCGTDNSNPAILTVHPSPTPTSAAQATNVCAGSTGNVYITQAGQSNYAWTVSAGGTITAGGPAPDITVTVNWKTAGARTVSINYRNASGCAATSASVSKVTVNPTLIASVSIVASPNPFCTGTQVTFTATPTNGGNAPTYQWKKGSNNVGDGLSTYTYVPVNGYIITCVMTSNASPCLTGSPATSNAVSMAKVIPKVEVSTATTDKCADTDPDLNLIALDSDYSPGNSSVTFTITRMTTGIYDWSFNYNILIDPVERFV